MILIATINSMHQNIFLIKPYRLLKNESKVFLYYWIIFRNSIPNFSDRTMAKNASLMLSRNK